MEEQACTAIVSKVTFNHTSRGAASLIQLLIFLNSVRLYNNQALCSVWEGQDKINFGTLVGTITGDACGLQAGNDCQIECALDTGECDDLYGYSYSDRPASWAPEGVTCVDFGGNPSVCGQVEARGRAGRTGDPGEAGSSRE